VNLPAFIRDFAQVPLLTQRRIWIAYAVAGAADGLQMWLSPLAISGLDDVLDIAVMVILTRVLGFHLLLLPTFVVEMIPVAGLMPTWVACTVAVVALRKREQHYQDEPGAQ
jgi:hypothetical protein